jgi:hypothetical protein
MKDYRHIEGVKKNKMLRMDSIHIASKAIGSGLLDRLGNKCYLGWKSEKGVEISGNAF